MAHTYSYKTLLSTHVCAAAITLLVGCNLQSPMEKKLPADGRLTLSESETIAKQLPGTEAQAFRKWADRMRKGEHFGGEGTARTVRDAVVAQQSFEAREAELDATRQLAERQAAKQEQAKEAAEQERTAQIYAHRLAVNSEVQKYIHATIQSYIPRTFYDGYNRPIGGRIEFQLKLSNRAPQTAVGVAGFINITDVFGTDLGTYPFAIEPRILPGQTVNYPIYLEFEPRNQQHQAMWRAKNLQHTWLFESAAFENGERIDARSVPPNTQSVPASGSRSSKPAT